MMPGIALVLSLLLGLLSGTTVMSQSRDIIPGHAHNDYVVNQPLTDALKQQFMSVEADVHLINGELYVSHDHPDSAATGTLKQLYLDPLAKIVSQNGGKVYPGYQGPFFLLVDFKTSGPETWRVLKAQLESYKDLLQTPNHQGPLTVVISGNRPVELINKEKNRLASVDGRPAELGKGYDKTFMPVVSEHFGKVTQWDGSRPLNKKDVKAVKALADQTHAEGKLLRLWAIPDNPEGWRTLLKAGVDLINTDKIKEFRRFYEEQYN